MTEECVHMLVPDWCSSCKGGEPTRRRGGYRFHRESEGTILLTSGRPFVPGFRMWYPYSTESAPTDVGTVHITGGWSGSHIRSLVKYNKGLCWIEFAPSQKPTVEDDGWLNYLASQPGGAIGVRLRSNRA